MAHLIITRSGGSSVAEILASCKPAIFIPLPNSFDNHQYENAKFFIDNNCGWVVDQNNDKMILKNYYKTFLMTKNNLLKQVNKLPNCQINY